MGVWPAQKHLSNCSVNPEACFKKLKKKERGRTLLFNKCMIYSIKFRMSWFPSAGRSSICEKFLDGDDAAFSEIVKNMKNVYLAYAK